ncbi:unnamed protein product [Mytilus edulis]|uniref:Uncharacterized protein n=1 Tax=Mytilus edulis TaxID=6550 RepID=A0A8S3U2J3_MYTED|nr:unnamed protein product [Mytilus edulis]
MIKCTKDILLHDALIVVDSENAQNRAVKLNLFTGAIGVWLSIINKTHSSTNNVNLTKLFQLCEGICNSHLTNILDNIDEEVPETIKSLYFHLMEKKDKMLNLKPLCDRCLKPLSRGLFKLDPVNQRSDTSNLCRLLPSSDSCTFKPKKNVLLNSKRSIGEYVFEFFYYTQAVCVCLQFITVIFLLPHIVCCLNTFCSWCTTCTGTDICLSFCFSDCFRWLLILIDGFVVGILCIISCSVLGLYLSPRDLKQIDGYFYCISSGILGIIKLVGYIVYLKKVGFTSDGYFYGCDSQNSDIDADKKLETTKY